MLKIDNIKTEPGADEAALRKKAAAALREEADSPDDEAVEALARRRLGLVLPGERIFLFIGEEAG